MAFKIPKEFQLGGQTFEVSVIPEEVEIGTAGLCNYDQGWVKVSSKTRYGKVPKDAQGRVFCHELLHLLLEAAGERELSDNEPLIERCSTLLYQFLRSCK